MNSFTITAKIYDGNCDGLGQAYADFAATNLDRWFPDADVILTVERLEGPTPPARVLYDLSDDSMNADAMQRIEDEVTAYLRHEGWEAFCLTLS